MDSHQFKQFKQEMGEHIEAIIQLKVNGKIDRITARLDTYIKDDEEWKLAAKPVLDLGNNITGFGKVVGAIVGVMAAIGSSWVLIQWIGGIFKK